MRKLKVGAIFRQTARLFLNSPETLVRSAGAWLVLVVVAEFAASAIARHAGHAAHSGSALITELAATTMRVSVQVVALAGCAVNIHRFILLQDNPAPMRISRLEWRYLFRTIRVWLPAFFVSVVAVVAIVIASLLLPNGAAVKQWWTGAPAVITWAIPMSLFVLLVVVLVLPRTLTLAATAIGQPEFGVSESEKALRGSDFNFCLLYLMIVGCGFALQLIGNVFALGIGLIWPGSTLLTIAARAMFDSLIPIAQTVLFAAIISFAYAGLVQGKAEFTT